MPINISIPETSELKPRITVIGVGGAGGNAVNNMIESQLEGVEFVVANTDAQAVGQSKATKKIQMGVSTTQGLGAGSMPDVGAAAAVESLDEILDHIGNSHMLFVTAGMGGGTGTGAAPVIAQAAKQQDILTVGVVTKPFHFEGARRMRVAMAGIEELQKHVDTLLIIPNQNLFSIADERTTFHEAFAMADEVLHCGVRGITDLMVMPGLINLDFADVRTVMGEMGQAMMGTGEAEGDKRAIEAAEAAISNPLLDKVSMKGARGVLINITGSMDMKLFEIDEAANRIRAEVDPDANIIIGSTFNQELEGKVRVSVVATGIDIERADGDVQPQAAPAQPARNVSPSKPWRDGEANNVASTMAGSDRLPAQDHDGHAMPAPQQNPVGDVQSRIRKLLTEGDTNGFSMPVTRTTTTVRRTASEADQSPPVRARQHADAGDQAAAEQIVQESAAAAQERPRLAEERDMRQKNPFRTGIARPALGAAVDAFKTISSTVQGGADQAGARHNDPHPQTSVPASEQRSGDLFEDDPDAELEIPAFLRKKKIG